MRLTSIFRGKSDNTVIHIIRSIFSSSLGFAVDFGMLAFLVEILGMYYLVAASISFAAGTTVTYILSVKYIFPNRNIRDKKLEFLLFMAVGAAGVLLNGVLLWAFTEHAGAHYLLSKIFAATIVFFWNFFARKLLLFR